MYACMHACMHVCMHACMSVDSVSSNKTSPVANTQAMAVNNHPSSAPHPAQRHTRNVSPAHHTSPVRWISTGNLGGLEANRLGLHRSTCCCGGLCEIFDRPQNGVLSSGFPSNQPRKGTHKKYITPYCNRTNYHAALVNSSQWQDATCRLI